jgi:hypothetical protein
MKAMFIDPIKEQQKADFMDHIYDVYQPGNGLYTGLWEKFKDEAAVHCRDEYFQKLKFIEDFNLDVALRQAAAQAWAEEETAQVQEPEFDR